MVFEPEIGGSRGGSIGMSPCCSTGYQSWNGFVNRARVQAVQIQAMREVLVCRMCCAWVVIYGQYPAVFAGCNELVSTRYLMAISLMGKLIEEFVYS